MIIEETTAVIDWFIRHCRDPSPLLHAIMANLSLQNTVNTVLLLRA